MAAPDRKPQDGPNRSTEVAVVTRLLITWLLTSAVVSPVIGALLHGGAVRGATAAREPVRVPVHA